MMNMIGTRTPVDAKSLCNSMPLITGNRIHMPAAPVWRIRGVPQPKNVSAAKPADRIRLQSRADSGSSSTI
jgi:hypothetical protein